MTDAPKWQAGQRAHRDYVLQHADHLPGHNLA